MIAVFELLGRFLGSLFWVAVLGRRLGVERLLTLNISPYSSGESMRLKPSVLFRPHLAVVVLSLFAVSTLQAQTRVVLPSGSVILVQTTQPLASQNAQVGQTFESRVVDVVSINGYAAIPANSRVRGVVSYVQPATRQRSGVMQVTFDRLILPNGTAVPIAGRLTSTDSTERRQIDARSDPRVVLVGERGGIGAAIAGAGSRSGSASNILTALGGLLSEGTDVSVPENTRLAVQLEQAVTLTARGGMNAADPSTVYTAAERIRAAQQALARRAYYRGTANGVLDNATRRALFEFQLDNDITATGNLDGRTAAVLGILAGGGNAGGVSGSVLSAREASTLRRAAQAMESRQRQLLTISTEGRLSPSRNYSQAELELFFAFSAFADNASLYEQLVSTTNVPEGAVAAGRALANAARRVDSAMQQANTSTQNRNNWQAIRQQISRIDSDYR
jgi:peptidoglycan hydrolase-like protein with peptidoglycan-binding domain